MSYSLLRMLFFILSRDLTNFILLSILRQEVIILEVKSYKKVKSNIYEIELNNFDKYKIYDDIILKYELLIDKRIDKNKLEKILKENGLLESYFKALRYINTKMRTQLEIKKYLEKYNFDKDQIDYAIDRLKKEGYLDENAYIKAFINDSILLTLNGPKKIVDSLKKLGLNSEKIKDEIDKVERKEWLLKIEKIIEKKYKTNKLGEKAFKSKLYNDLSILGFYCDDIKDLLDKYTFNDSSLFLREAEKLYNKLSAKYSDTELELRFRSKMFSKGFKIDDINDFLRAK